MGDKGISREGRQANVVEDVAMEAGQDSRSTRGQEEVSGIVFGLFGLGGNS